MNDLAATLVAVATPPGRGGIGCVRISGPAAATVAERLFRPVGKDKPGGDDPIRFGRFLDRRGRPMDHGYLVRFAAEASYTGEPTVELWAHGSPAVLAELVDGAIAAGGVPAGPGEFTYRALRNGRLDLSRAEAVRDLVAARTLFQARVAFAQAEGALSRRVAPMRESLADLISRTEAAVEFAEESETHLAPGALAREVDAVLGTCESLLTGFRAGQLVREGAVAVITGLPNVGKSSLFNRLLERERAIVAEMPGTTRDTLEESLDLGGVPVRLVDTAGLREVADVVECEGVRRARRAREEADLELLVLDGSRGLDPAERHALEILGASGRRAVVVVNKCDLASSGAAPGPEALRVSARTGEGVERLRVLMRETLVGTELAEEPILTNARHARSLRETASALGRARQALREGFTEEVALVDLREAMDHLGEITGAFTTEDLYDRIFSTFCIGK